MEIITTHTNADFDALASMIGIKKLYPEAKLIFPGTQEKNVRRFIETHHIQFDRLKDISPEEVTRLILVDNKSKDRLGKLGEMLDLNKISLHIYDHHPLTPGDLRGEVEKIEEVGATTTLIVELLKEKNIPLSEFELELFAIAIYEETGSLTFPNTTQRDLMAVAYLLSMGLNLRNISRYLIHELDADQIALLDELIHNARTYYIDSIKIVIAKASTDKYVSELSTITHKVRDMENLDVLFVLVRMEDKIQMVARSRINEVDVGEIAREFGGGGHATAAAATIKELTTIQVEERILQLLHEKIKPFKTAKDIMSTPVKTIQKDLTVKEAGDLMTQYEVNVLPVLDGEKLIGLITREIIQKAIFHKFGDMPVTDFMSTEFHTVTKDTPFREVEALMIEHNQRFMPVVEGDRIIGAITRTDLLRALHEDIAKTWATPVEAELKTPRERNLRGLLKDRLPSHIEKLLRDIGHIADEMGVSAYVVGGFVRDLLLGVENYDIDIVIEGDGMAFAERFAAWAGARVKVHPRFGTAVVIFPDGFKIDIATARTEYYEYPTALPTVELSSIKKDLYRRDFTINTLAIKLNTRDFGYLIDFFGGQRDLKEKTIRVLHNLSFIEDPTRIYRAIRFEQRYGFKIARHTQNLIRSATKIDLFPRLSGKRLFNELMLILSEENPEKPVARLAEFDLLRFIHSSLEWNERIASLFQKIKDILAWYRLLFLGKKYEPWLVYFMGLIDELSIKEAEETCKRLEIRPRITEEIIRAKREVPQMIQKLKRMRILKPSRIYEILKGLPQETLLYMMAKSPADVQKKISFYLSKLQDVRTSISGRDLQALRIPPGPIYGKLLYSVLKAKLDGIVKTKEDEIKLVKRLLKRKIKA